MVRFLGVVVAALLISGCGDSPDRSGEKGDQSDNVTATFVGDTLGISRVNEDGDVVAQAAIGDPCEDAQAVASVVRGFRNGGPSRVYGPESEDEVGDVASLMIGCDGPDDESPGVFSRWTFGAGDRPSAISASTAEGLSVGMPLTELLEIYPDAYLVNEGGFPVYAAPSAGVCALLKDDRVAMFGSPGAFNNCPDRGELGSTTEAPTAAGAEPDPSLPLSGSVEVQAPQKGGRTIAFEWDLSVQVKTDTSKADVGEVHVGLTATGPLEMSNTTSGDREVTLSFISVNGLQLLPLWATASNTDLVDAGCVRITSPVAVGGAEYCTLGSLFFQSPEVPTSGGALQMAGSQTIQFASIPLDPPFFHSVWPESAVPFLEDVKLPPPDLVLLGNPGNFVDICGDFMAIVDGRTGREAVSHLTYEGEFNPPRCDEISLR